MTAPKTQGKDNQLVYYWAFLLRLLVCVCLIDEGNGHCSSWLLAGKEDEDVQYKRKRKED